MTFGFWNTLYKQRQGEVERRKFAAWAYKGHNEAIFGLKNCGGRTLHGPMAASTQ